jgi:hypothetical protein
VQEWPQGVREVGGCRFLENDYPNFREVELAANVPIPGIVLVWL